MKSKKGFASMDPAQQRAIASKGGKSAHAMGRAHVFTSEQAREAGRKGGVSVAKNRAHMVAIARKGGRSISKNKDHMSEIGAKGGLVRAARAGG